MPKPSDPALSLEAEHCARMTPRKEKPGRKSPLTRTAELEAEKRRQQLWEQCPRTCELWKGESRGKDQNQKD